MKPRDRVIAESAESAPLVRLRVMGQSLGTGVAVEMAVRGHGGRLVLVSPYTSMPDTEWPASEKARLQSLTASQVVAVAYSGCEMRIVAGCRIPGTYRWQQTTPATDSVEIDDADQLYAKLPLGAVSLEGELQRSGHFSIRTTVSGQLKLGEIDRSQVAHQHEVCRLSPAQRHAVATRMPTLNAAICLDRLDRHDETDQFEPA